MHTHTQAGCTSTCVPAHTYTWCTDVSTPDAPGAFNRWAGATAEEEARGGTVQLLHADALPLLTDRSP
jgi:hypothetical protein